MIVFELLPVDVEPVWVLFDNVAEPDLPVWVVLLLIVTFVLLVIVVVFVSVIVVEVVLPMGVTLVEMVLPVNETVDLSLE